jgi:hypothetical protein
MRNLLTRQQRANLRLVFSWKTLSVLTLAGLAVGDPGNAAGPLEAKAGHLATMRALHLESGRAVVSDFPQMDLQTDAPIEDIGSEASLTTITGAFHLHCVVRPRSYTFQQRYVTAFEMPQVEVAELQATAEQYDRLLRPLYSRWDNASETLGQNRFYHDLSSQDLKEMRERGLPVGRLKVEQRAQWEKIHNDHAFGHESLHVGRVQSIFKSWRRNRLAYITETMKSSEGRDETTQHLCFVFLNPERPDGQGLLTMLPPGVPLPAPKSFGPTAPSIESARDLGMLGPALDRRLDGEDHAEWTLSGLAARLKEALGRDVVFPTYAKDRKLIALVSGSRCADVIQSVAAL